MVIGSLVVESWVEVTEVTDDLAARVCLTREALSTAVAKGYRYMWSVQDARQFRKPILGVSIYKNGVSCQVWTYTDEAPKVSMPKRGDVVARMLLILKRRDPE
jgi:hypothetical protein